MKIAFLAFTSIPKLGGAQVFAFNLAKILSLHSHQVHFYLPRKYHNLVSRLPIDQSIKFKPILFCENWFSSYAPRFIYWTLLLRQIFHRYQVWQVIGVYPAGFISCKLSNRVPVVLRAHGDDIQKDESLSYGIRLNRIIEKQIESTVNEVTCLVAISNTVSECYKELGVSEEKICLIPNGVEILRFRQSIDRKQFRYHLGISNGGLMILSVGRYHKKKGFELALESAKILLQKGLKFKWVIIGKGVNKLKPLAINLGVNNVIYLLEKVGSIQNRESKDSFQVPSRHLIDFYRSSDIFVLPSLLETFGMVLIEAMAAGTPVITTEAPGCRDVVSHEYDGLLAAPGDPISLADNIEKLIIDVKLRRELCSNALMNVKKYDYSEIANQYMNLYSELAGKDKYCSE
jgi:glycosyltransferase involved in cell wall biosynthesis|tara:strand:+ start:27040 stop:28245 length:1206 start_codon:yes stop_codon:yes gene_type:complete